MNSEKMNDKQMIEKLQNNKLPWCFLEKAEQDFLGKHPEHTMILTSNGFAPKNLRNYATFYPANVYRLSPDFQLPAEPERWFLRDHDHALLSSIKDWGANGFLIEITADDAPCVKNCIEMHKAGKVNLAEFEFRFAKKGERYIANGDNQGTLMTACCDHCAKDGTRRFVRKPAKEPRFVEYPISNEAGQHYCLIGTEVFDKVDNIPIHELPSIVGFAGIKYRKGDGTETNFRDRCVFTQGSKEPATPIAARFYIKGGLK